MIGRACAATVAIALAAAAAADEPLPLEFHRVHVPAGRLGDVPLDGERRVPVPLADFEAAVARATAAAAGRAAEPTAACESARWLASIDGSGLLVGTVACTVGPAAAGPGRVLPLGGLRVRRGQYAGDPPREAAVCGAGAGLGLPVPERGIYELEFTCPPDAPGSTLFRLPLVPALSTSLALDLPPGTRPVLSGPAARRAVVVAPVVGGVTWRIDVGPATELVVAVVAGDEPPPAVAVWADAALSATQAEFAAAIVPAGPWRAGRIVLEQDAALRVTDVHAADDPEPLAHETSGDGRSLAVTLPRRLDGARTRLEVRGVAPATGAGWRLPLLRAGAVGWAGGGSVVRVAPEFEVRDVELEDCRVVPPGVAASWPAAAGVDEPAGAILHLEQQGPAAAAVVELGPRMATFDVARVTTVDITPSAVLGRAACDVRVTGGDAFEIVGRVAPGWIIDSVDAVDWTAAGPSAAGGPAPAGNAVDWRVVPSPAGDALRVGLAFGATRRGGVGLRIAGHRAGLAPGAAFTTADIDMVRFDGEAADAAVLDLRTGPDAFVEIAGRPAGWFALEGRLAALAEEGKARGRIRAGDRTPDLEARIVRRPPPLDVDVVVRLEPRDDALVQTFTFDCRAAAGIESLVVDFGEPGGDGLTWRVESPADLAVSARRIGPGDGGLAARSPAVAASWLVELSPPANGPVRIRAVRSVAFGAAVPVPLAWVEGAETNGGTVVVAAPPGARPRLVNRLLRELPVDPAAAAAPAEYAYGAPAPAAAEIVPVEPGSDARAWAWRETVSCRCEESGAVEIESRFAIENEGRDTVSLSSPPGRQVTAVLVDGVPPPGMEIGVDFGAAGETPRIPLPHGRRRVEIVVRALAAGRVGGPAWLIDPEGCSLDLPVLERDVRLLVPPGLVVATPPATDPAATASWAARLFGAGGAGRTAESESSPGFRVVPLALPTGRGALVVRRDAITAAAILAAVAAGSAAFLLARRRPAAAVALAATAGVAALWLPDALVPVVRAAWLAAVGGLVAGLASAATWRPGWARRAAAAACVVAAAASLPAAADDADAGGHRVYVTPGDGGDVALVPEPLFRALAAFTARETAAIRVLACRIAAGDTAADAWRLMIDVDADAGGTLVLDCGPGGRWLPTARAGAVVTACAGREARLTAVTAGRHTVELGLEPEVVRSGPVEMATARIPVAPIAELQVDAGAAGTIECERAAAAGAFARTTPTAGGAAGLAFDVSAADRVRLVRPVDPRDRLAVAVRAADTVNDLAWDAAGCGVTATIELDAGPDLLRSFAVRVDPRLETLAATTAAGEPARLVPLGDDRVLVELAEPARGRISVTLEATLPLADPVGVFAAPGVWVDGLPAETRTVRLAAAAGFDALLDPPPPAGATAAELAGRPPARVVVRRRRSQVRDVQSLAVSFAPTGFGLALEARIDATAAALATIPIDLPVGCAVDRVTLDVEDAADPDVRAAVDIAWTRQAADRVLVALQRPRPGRFRLEVEGRLARRPAQRGPLPVIRARLGTDAPLVVTWTAEPPLEVAIRDAGTTRPDLVEVPPGGPEPEYEVATAEAAPPRPSPPSIAAGPGENRVERAEVRVACDRQGRVHGLARFDVVASGPTVRLRLPSGVRLFDVLVDGRVVAAEPRAADAWDVPLGAAPWPRTILAVFAGEAAAPNPRGPWSSLTAPWLDGLPGPSVLWTLQPPAGFAVSVAPPARLLDVAALAAAREAAAERIAATCADLAAGAAGSERERLEALAALRRADRGPIDEEAWRGAGAVAAGDAVVAELAATEPLAIRMAPVTDGTAPARALATLALVAVGGLAWTAAARDRAARRAT